VKSYSWSISLINIHMKKTVLLTALCAIGAFLGVGYFYWQRATALPEWFADEPTTSPSPAAGIVGGASSSPSTTARPATVIQAELQTAKPGKVQTQLTAEEVDNLIVAGLNQGNSNPGTLPKAVKKIKTQIKKDQIRTGAVLDLAEVDNLPASSRQDLLKKLLKVMPQLKGQPVYVGFVGKLSVAQGKPQLSTDSKLQIGQVELPLDEVAQRLGVSRQELTQTVTSYLQFRNLRLENIQLTDQGAVITGQKGELHKKAK
jgi:hypothetical protein